MDLARETLQHLGLSSPQTFALVFFFPLFTLLMAYAWWRHRDDEHALLPFDSDEV